MVRSASRFASSTFSRRRFALAAVFGSVALVSVVRHDAVAATPVVTRFHLALSKAEPAANDTVAASPTAIKLWFTETVQASATSIRVTGPGAHAVALGAATLDAAPKSPAVFAVKESLKPGTYNVAWKTMATDGHPSSGTFVFVLAATGMGTK